MANRKTGPIGSAKNIKIKKPAATDHGYAELIADTAGNKNHQAIAFITAAIENGVNTEEAIVSLAYHNGLNHRHVAMILKKGAKSNVYARYWRADQCGIYSLLA